MYAKCNSSNFIAMQKVNLHNNEAPIFGISRLRLGTDGAGVTTLVTFMGCPLKCKYCLNKICHESVFKSDGNISKENVKLLTPQKLYDKVKIDNIYFCATGGGICFGGGEPALQWKFIKAFRGICGDKWRITIETCLHYPEDVVRKLSEVIDFWIVDIKSLDAETYNSYTGVMPIYLNRNLEILLNLVSKEKITIKVPLIPRFNDENQTRRSIKRMLSMGFENVEKVDYTI